MTLRRQKDVLPTILNLVGVLVHILFIGGTLPYLISGSIYILEKGLSLSTLWSLTEFAVGIIGLVWSLPLIVGSFLVSAFPKVRVTKNGIEYGSYMIFRSLIKWSEIHDVKHLPKGYKAIEISRPGWPLINGLYSNKIYGDIVKSNFPVILISPALKNIESFMQEVEMHRDQRRS